MPIEEDTAETEKDAYIKILEEAVKAALFFDNYQDNHGLIAKGGLAINGSYDDHNARVERLRRAYKTLPLEIFVEVHEENAIVYADLYRDQSDREPS